MGLLNKEIFVCVDCETTGLDVKSDRVIEIGAVRFTLEHEIDRYQTLVNPDRKISAESMEIHNITDEMVEKSPLIAEVLPEALAFLKEGIIIGHGIGFDLDIIAEEAKNPDLFKGRTVIDTLRLARLYGQSPSNSLEGLRRHFNIPAQMAHRALDDAHVNAEVFGHLTKQFRTMKEIQQALAKPIRMRTMPLGRHKGRPFKEIPLDYLRWAATKDFDMDLLFSIRSEINRRKKGGEFRQASNPFGSL